MSSHKKKRNSGLLYEFLVQSIASSLVDENSRKAKTALKVLKRHYKPGTTLFKEFRLINSLVKTTVSSEHVAASIMNEAKKAARGHDMTLLDREKSILIKNINHRLNDPMFYDQHVNEYRMYATVQTLLNDWRSNDPDLSRQAAYEDELIKWLTTEKFSTPDIVINEESAGTGRLVMRMMTQKLNEKYAEVLNETQRAIIRTYMWSTTRSDNSAIKQKLTEVKDSLVSKIDSFDEQNNEFINKKLVDVKARLVSESLDIVDDDTVSRFMLYVKLSDELDQKDHT